MFSNLLALAATGADGATRSGKSCSESRSSSTRSEEEALSPPFWKTPPSAWRTDCLADLSLRYWSRGVSRGLRPRPSSPPCAPGWLHCNVKSESCPLCLLRADSCGCSRLRYCRKTKAESSSSRILRLSWRGREEEAAEGDLAGEAMEARDGGGRKGRGQHATPHILQGTKGGRARAFFFRARQLHLVSLSALMFYHLHARALKPGS